MVSNPSNFVREDGRVHVGLKRSYLSSPFNPFEKGIALVFCASRVGRPGEKVQGLRAKARKVHGLDVKSKKTRRKGAGADLRKP
jgi:hypothetical protein